jgi:hypothetical protein
VPETARDTDPAPDPRPTAEEAASEVRYLPAPVTGEAVEARPVRPLERLTSESLPPAVVAATGGFLAGIASFVLVRILRGRPQRIGALSLGRRRRRKLDVAGTRSFLVDVHVLRR